MPNYRYKAVTAAGEVVEGQMDARDRAAVTERLQELGHLPLKAEEVRGGADGSWLRRDLFADRPVAAKWVTLFTRDLASLLAAGLPLERAMQIQISLAERENQRALLTRVLDAVRGGASLADALAAQRGVFAGDYVSMVRAGEAGGALETVLQRLAEFLERTEALKEGIRSALIYPVILLLMAGFAITVLLTVVVPEFKPLFEDAGAALPLGTRVIIAAGDIASRWWWAAGLLLIALVLLLRRRLANPAFRLRWDGMLLATPLFGELIRKIQVARFSRTLGTLLRNGVTLLGALSIVRETLGNAVLAQAVGHLAERLREGRRLADLLSETGVFPSLAAQLVRVGEETGQLDDMLLRVADIYEREVQLATGRLLSLLVPLLTIGLGLLIAAIIASVMSAFLSINELAF